MDKITYLRKTKEKIISLLVDVLSVDVIYTIHVQAQVKVILSIINRVLVVYVLIALRKD